MNRSSDSPAGKAQAGGRSDINEATAESDSGFLKFRVVSYSLSV
jgi:hypothetical protein